MEAYKLWHNFLQHLPRTTRYTLGIKIDALFTETVELILLAGYANKNQKSIIVQKANAKLDGLKFFLQIARVLKILDNKKYAALSAPLLEIGKMLGGWRKQLEKETLPMNFGRE